MSRSDRFVSVVIPVYNGERYLRQAVESVLEQTHRPLEIIIVDDGSTDGTAAVAAQFGDAIRYVLQTNGGAASARNHGAELATGNYLAFLDADDLWVPTKLSRQLQMLEENPDIQLVFGYVRQFISPELDEGTRSGLHCPPEAMAGYSQTTLLMARETFFHIGPFTTHWEVGEFMDWYARAQEAGLKTAMLPEVVSLRRLHTTNQGVSKRDERADYARVLKAALDRRRQKSGQSAT
jgi:glycosyltransferase involved in cell wall biosynthesis